MSRIQELVRAHFSSAGGELVVGGIPVSRLVALHDTPIFVHDRAVMLEKLRQLRETFTDRCRIFYSIKANPNTRIVKCFVEQGCGLEIASEGEFRRALEAGCAAEDTLFAGPGKTERELEVTLRHGIGEIHAESMEELGRLSRIARRHGLRANVGIRVNPQEDAQGGAMCMGGLPSPFGFPEEDLEEAVKSLCAEESLSFRGIHMFSGTQILSHQILLAQYRKALEIAVAAARIAGSPLHTIDFGGGLGIPYFPQETPLDLQALREGLQALLSEQLVRDELKSARIVVEPGRFLVGESGIYVTRVNTVKVSRGKKFLVVDGGMNHHLAASGNLGQVIKRNYPLAILNKLDRPEEETVDVVGPLCTPLDTLARQVSLPRAEVGDLVGIFQSGAYARTASPIGFLSRPPPGEILVDRGEITLIQPPGLAEIQ
jgi:diaminopimelate decarboxylase